MLRTHQTKFYKITDQIRSGSPIKKVIVSVTPGGGKSILPVIAGIQLIPKVADKLCWVVPRLSLAFQAEQEFAQGRSRDLFKHSLNIRHSTNEPDPCRGTDGYVTTYDAIMENPRLHEEEFSRYRYALILDESHHVVEGGPTHAALDRMVKQASILILMSGTLERNVDTERIAYLSYNEGIPGHLELDLADTENTKVIIYSLRDALAEKAVIPSAFTFHDGSAKFHDGKKEKLINSIALATGKDVRAALYTVLRTEHARELLDRTVQDWVETRKVNPRAKMLVVAARIDHAKSIAKHLTDIGISSIIATSENPDEAQAAIASFRNSSSLNCLVTVMMAYEGLDVPAITHVACLTHIRSKPWLEQMIARANRVDYLAGPYEYQIAKVYAPDDMLIRDVVSRIQDNQRIFIRVKQDQEVVDEPESDEEGSARMGVLALESKLTGIKQYSMSAAEAPLSYIEEDVTAILTSRANEQRKQAPTKAKVVSTSAQEALLKTRLDKLTKQADRLTRSSPGTVNKVIYKEFGKSRQNMLINELESVITWLKKTYKLTEQ